MDAFENGDTSPEQPELSVGERLAGIDHAYSNGLRATCVQLVDDLYAYFDEMSGGAMSCLAIAAVSMFGFISAFD